jgi:hypothetical protein
MNSLIKISVFLATFLIGQFSYDTIYWWTLKTIRFLTGDKLQFYGKLWDFMGKPSFGFVALLFPISVFIGIKINKLIRQVDLIKYWLVHFLFLGLFYFPVCYLYGQYLITQINARTIYSNDYSIHLGNVNLYVIGIATILLSAISTFLCFRFWLVNKQQ